MTHCIFRFQLTRSQMSQQMEKAGESTQHTKSWLKHIYQNTPFKQPSTTSQNPSNPHLYTKLIDSFKPISSKIKKTQICPTDRSVKLMIELSDQHSIETVILREKTRITLCVSSQVGCGQGCVFCATAKMKLIRQLKTHEIIEQYICARWWIQNHRPWQEIVTDHNRHVLEPLNITNVVFMGMGEPCDNAAEVINAIEIFTDPWCLGLAPRKVTLSTAGHICGLKAIYQAMPRISYAVSIHSSLSARRSALMPINRHYPLADLLDYLRTLSIRDHKKFFIQYTLISKINDSCEDAHHLSQALQGISCKINLLTYNPIPFVHWKPPTQNQIQAFADTLRSHGHHVSCRYSKAQKIDGACGQLILTHRRPHVSTS